MFSIHSASAMISLTVDDNSPLKARVGRVRKDEKDINEADETDLAGPLFAVYFNLPWMNITKSSISERSYGKKTKVESLPVAFHCLILDGSPKHCQNAVVRIHRINERSTTQDVRPGRVFLMFSFAIYVQG